MPKGATRMTNWIQSHLTRVSQEFHMFTLTNKDLGWGVQVLPVNIWKQRKAIFVQRLCQDKNKQVSTCPKYSWSGKSGEGSWPHKILEELHNRHGEVRWTCFNMKLGCLGRDYMMLLSAVTGITLEGPSRPLCLGLWLEGSWQLPVTSGQASSLAQKLNCSMCRMHMMSLVSSDVSFSFNFENFTNSKLIIRGSNLEDEHVQQWVSLPSTQTLMNSNYLSLRAWFLISSTSWKTRERGERNTSTARKFFCHGETVAFTKICWM